VGRKSIKELLLGGVTKEDIEAAIAFQKNQRAAGVTPLPIEQIVGASKPRVRIPHTTIDSPAQRMVDFTMKALRKRGVYEQAALLIDQHALLEKSPERAAMARQASEIVKDLALTTQFEFDFFGGGNVSLAFQYQDAISERLRNSGQTLARQQQAKAVLWDIVRHLSWQSYTCQKTAAELADVCGMRASHMSDTLDLLEQVGAIVRVKRGRTKIITVTPEGAFRGDVNNHGKVVERYRLEVIDGGKNGQVDIEEYLDD
jgi:hypothetical protein